MKDFKSFRSRFRLAFCHNGVDTFDSLFVELFSHEFETFFVTFVRPTQNLSGVRVVKIPDFGRAFKIRKLNNLRIVLGTLWRILLLRHVVRLIRPDILVGNWVTTYGLYASLCREKPFILFAYGSDLVVDPRRSFLHRLITARVIRSADLILIDSEVQRSAVLELGCPPQRIVLFPWVNLDDTKDIVPDSGFRRHLNWHDKIIVVSVRKHEPIYAVDTLIRAVPKVLTQCPNVRFLIFGCGTQTRDLVRLADHLKVTEFVIFGGNVSRKRLLEYVKDCDIYASTSLSDGCSSSLLEAMSLGVPAVVTSIPGNAEWIRDGWNGILFDPRDSDGLGEAIVRIARCPEEAKDFIIRASKEVRSRVNWHRSTQELIQKMYYARSIYARARA